MFLYRLGYYTRILPPLRPNPPPAAKSVSSPGAAAALLPVLLLPPPPADMTDVARTLSVSAVTAIIGYISTSLLNLRAQR